MGGGSPFAVTRDGQRFLVLATTDDKTPSAPIDVVVNWR
jgi:orotate phosphoribosyltransferase-like protein